jgi:hypothetical protein
MNRRLHLVDTSGSASHTWPSIAAASTELRRPRHLRVVSNASDVGMRRERLPDHRGAFRLDRQAG